MMKMDVNMARIAAVAKEDHKMGCQMIEKMGYRDT